MFYDGYDKKGACPAGGGHERHPDAYRFVLPHDKPKGFGDDNILIPASD
ncbi:MAG: hypothetical protein LC808_43130 [Actinobacteria bacterium]|nr:hypothetical protein [Actinomycetota bacterium]